MVLSFGVLAHRREPREHLSLLRNQVRPGGTLALETLVLPDDRQACEYGFRGARFFAESMATYYFGSERPLGRLKVPREFLSADDLQAAMAFRTAAGSQCNTIVGDPSAARELVSRFVSVGVDELLCVMQLGTVPHELVMESIRTFGEQVIPHFR